jgi:RNA polymerase sigma-70 factor (ECF subfamily)
MSGTFAIDDEALVRRMLAGREDAFTEIYTRCSGPVYRFALHMTGQTSLAEEITQETFVYLFSNGRAFNALRGSLLSWLLGIARNLSRRAIGSLIETEPLDESVAQEPAPAIDLLAEFTRRELIDSLWQAIASLPPAYREVVLLCEMQELSYQDAATALACPVGTVRSRLHRARAMLVSKLQSRCLV